MVFEARIGQVQKVSPIEQRDHQPATIISFQPSEALPANLSAVVRGFEEKGLIEPVVQPQEDIVYLSRVKPGIDSGPVIIGAREDPAERAQRVLMEVLNKPSEREQKAARLLYSLDDGKERTAEEAAREMDTTEEDVVGLSENFFKKIQKKSSVKSSK